MSIREALEKRLAAGDKPAFDELWRCFESRLELWVHARLKHSLRPRLDPADILQEASMVALKRFAELRLSSTTEFLAWMLTILELILSNVHRDHKDRKCRDVRREIPFAHLAVTSSRTINLPDPHAMSPSRQFESESQRQQLYEAVSTLPAIQREAILLVRIAHMKVREAAQRMGKSAPQVSCALAHGLANLRHQLCGASHGYPYLRPDGN